MYPKVHDVYTRFNRIPNRSSIPLSLMKHDHFTVYFKETVSHKINQHDWDTKKMEKNQHLNNIHRKSKTNSTVNQMTPL